MWEEGFCHLPSYLSKLGEAACQMKGAGSGAAMGESLHPSVRGLSALWNLIGWAGIANVVWPGGQFSDSTMLHVAAALTLARLLVVVHELGHVVAGRLTGFPSTGIDLGEGPVRWRGQVLGLPLTMRSEFNQGMAHFTALPLFGRRGALAVLYVGGTVAVVAAGALAWGWAEWRHGIVWPAGSDTVHLSQLIALAAAWLTVAGLFPRTLSHPSIPLPVPSDGLALWLLARNLPLTQPIIARSASRWERLAEILAGGIMAVLLPLWVVGVGFGIWLLVDTTDDVGAHRRSLILSAGAVIFAFLGVATVTAVTAWRLLRRRSTNRSPRTLAELRSEYHQETSQSLVNLMNQLPPEVRQQAANALRSAQSTNGTSAADALFLRAQPGPGREWWHARWLLQQGDRPAALQHLDALLLDPSISRTLALAARTQAWPLRIHLAGHWSPDTLESAEAWTLTLEPLERASVLDSWLSTALLEESFWPGQTVALRWANVLQDFPEPTFAGTAGSTHVAAGQLDAGRRLLQTCLAKTQADLDRAVAHQFLAWAASRDNDLSSAALHAAQARRHGLSGDWHALLERWESNGWPPPRR